MIQIEIRTPNVDPHREHVAWEGIAWLRVEGSEYQLDDPTGAIDLTVPAPDLRSGRTLQFETDPEEWARSLPAVYRGPEIVAAVTHDDNPVPVDDAGVERESVSVPETAPEHAVH